MGVTARSGMACLLLCLPAVSATTPAHAAWVQLDPRYDGGWPTAGPPDEGAMPGATEFDRLSRPLPIRFGFAEAARTARQGAEGELDAGDPLSPPQQRRFQPAEDPILLADIPPSAGWVPAVGGLALVAYRIRRGNRRFRSAV